MRSRVSLRALKRTDVTAASNRHEEYTKLRAAKSVKQMVEAKTADEMVGILLLLLLLPSWRWLEWKKWVQREDHH